MVPTRPVVQRQSRANAPRRAPCPFCGTPGRRKQRLTRTVRGLAYQAVLLVHVTTAEYRATCGCCATFRTQVEGIAPKAQYTDAVRGAVLDRVLDDHMSLQRVLAALRRDFLLDLSPGFVYDCLRDRAAQLDMAAYRRWTLQEFSGTLCIDEIHLGQRTVVLATDPVGDFPVAFALVSDDDQDHLGRFLRQLRGHGFWPRVVVTDGSGLYPALVAQTWPQAEHQLCLFHLLQDVNDAALTAVRRLRRALGRRGNVGRKRRGRQPVRRRGPTAKEKAHFVYRHRHLMVTRRDRLTALDRRHLGQMLEYLPPLRLLRRFIDQFHKLVERSQVPAQAWQRYEAMQADKEFAAVAELAGVLRGLPPEKFGKVVAFLGGPAGGRVRTNNHVERLNRVLRHYEKARYGWRTNRGVVRFLVLLLERRWRQREGVAQPRLYNPGGAWPMGPIPRATPAEAQPEQEVA